MAETPEREGANNRRRRVMLLGLDAAESSLLLEGARSGALPNLARMHSSGAWGIVDSPAGFGSGAVWPSVATAVSPAEHARYYYRQVPHGGYEARRFEAEELRAVPVWDRISAAGRRIAVIDVPKIGVSSDINGVSVVDWISHGPVYRGLRTWPESYAGELTRRYGTDPLPKCDMPGGRNESQMREFLEIMTARIEQRERLTADLWADAELDLLVSVFAEPHCVGHQTWHVRDTEHPQFDAELHAALGDPVMMVYAEIDAAVGRLLEAVDGDTTVIVFSGTGMGPNYTGSHVLDEVLRRLDGVTMTTRRSLTTRAKRVAKRLLPRELRRRGRPLKRRVEEGAAAGDRARRRSFAVPHNDISGAIRLNIAGRERHGVIQPGEVEAYIADLRDELLALRNADTGEKVVDEVVVVADENSGEALDRMPDLFVVWNRSQPIDRVRSDSVGVVEYLHRGNRTGDHTPKSCLFAIGAGVVPGPIDGMTIYDLMPTVAALLGVDAGPTDGKVVGQLTADDSEIRA